MALALTACGGPTEIPAPPRAIPPQAAMEAAGPTNTGVPAGTRLTPSPSLRITEPGAVIAGLDVDGCVVIAADNVTIKNSRIRCRDTDVSRAINKVGDISGTVINDVEIDGGGVTEIGVDVGSAHLIRLNVHGVNDGVRIGDDAILEFSWVHDLARKDDLHPDAVQGISSNDVIIRGNTLDPRGSGGSDLGNAAIMLGSETEPFLTSNVFIEENILNGGNYSLNIRRDTQANNVVVRDNSFGDDSRYGPILSPSSVEIGAQNIMSTTGSSARIDRP